MKNILIFSCLIAISPVISQTKIIADLATFDSTKVKKMQITSGKFKSIELLNKLPRANYEVSVKVEWTQYDPLKYPSKDGSLTAESDPCPSLTTAINAFDTLKIDGNQKKKHLERSVPAHINNLENEIKGCDNSDYKKKAVDLIKETKIKEEFLIPVDLKKSQKMTITIRREDGYTWTMVIDSGTKGTWRTMYGFSYSGNILSKTKHYASVRNQGDTTYMIKKGKSDKKYYRNLSPTIMFTYTPNSNKTFRLGWTGGIGIDLEKPSAMFGPSLVIADNLSITTGIAFVEKFRLKDKYTVGQNINEELDFDQLHEGGIENYAPEVFFSISFRFNENPFGKNDDTNKKEED